MDKEDYGKAESLLTFFMKQYDIGPAEALAHMQSWADHMFNAYHERLATDKKFKARFDRREKQYKTRRKKVFLKCKGCD